MKDTSFAQNLKQLRKEKKLSQAEFAEILGVSQSAVSAWEAGMCLPVATTVIRIVKFFDVTADFLLGIDS